MIEEVRCDTITDDCQFVFMDCHPNEMNAGILYVKNRLGGLGIALWEYAQLTGIVSPNITSASSVQNLSHPVTMVPFAAVTPRMSLAHMPHYNQYPPPGFQRSIHPQQVQKI